MCQVINHHFGRSKDFLTSPVTALEHLKDGVVGLGRVMALGNGFMPVRVKWLTRSEFRQPPPADRAAFPGIFGPPPGGV